MTNLSAHGAKRLFPAEPVQFAGDRQQRVVGRLMCEVILLLALHDGGQAASPQFGAGSPQQQLVQAG
jgi:hypothetical protein